MIGLVAAPSNLGLRPPRPRSVPGTAKAPEALREAGLFRRLGQRGAVDAGVVLPGRYVDDDGSRPTDVVRNQEQLVVHSRRLAGRIASVLDAGHAPLVIGGDCSILLAAGIATARRGGTGLVHIDGHTDFRHPGNSRTIGSVAGEDLAAAIGAHTDAIADIDGLRPYFRAARVSHLGHRGDDEYADEVRRRIGLVIPAADVTRENVRAVADRIRATSAPAYWLQLDVDVLDPSVMPAVDSPAPGGLGVDELVALLRALAPEAVGASVTVFDPDLDPDGTLALRLTDALVDGLGELGTRVVT
ncbi:arginase family protein [Pseudoclavibacter chungangensis]|uniref:Arginase family protein n=1 Tax=Pseudoclavibacter chungangensis TaxID=587635 RepID=A0A7J5BMS7_9MICO|nr:arginase family protein [Pseudoclavibacter chungangensis]KAB1652093.1 arginase family protein [Pseudoclavibacter chungangensis]NYJ65980.1 arginase [Pseudoclavibacter chungangensis]